MTTTTSARADVLRSHAEQLARELDDVCLEREVRELQVGTLREAEAVLSARLSATLAALQRVTA